MNCQDVAELIRTEINELAQRLVDLHFSQAPQLRARYGQRGRLKCLEDAAHHLRYLAASIEFERSIPFVEYAKWASAALDARGIPRDDFAQALKCLREVLDDRFRDEMPNLINETILAALRVVSAPCEPQSISIDASSAIGAIAENYLRFVLAGRRAEAVEMVLAARRAGLTVKQVYLEILQPTQYEIGRLWQTNVISVAQEHYCSAITQFTMSQLYPDIFAGDKRGVKLVASCIAGDLHEIGLRMVADLFEMEGWDTYYVGANTPAAAIVDMVQRENPRILALSSTMIYHVGAVRATISSVRNLPGGDRVQVLVGGNAFAVDPSLVDWVGADATASNAEEAVRVADQLVGRGKT